jgi:hypothetical protein
MGRHLDRQLERETRRGLVDRVTELLDQGAALDKVGRGGFTPLMLAAYQGHDELVGVLLRRGADANATAADGATALFWACVRQNAAVALRLIAAGARANAVRECAGKPSMSYSVLNAAVGSGAPADVVAALLRAGASVDHRFLGRDMVEFATWQGRQDLIPLLKPGRPRRRT